MHQCGWCDTQPQCYARQVAVIVIGCEIDDWYFGQTVRRVTDATAGFFNKAVLQIVEEQRFRQESG
jgi:hypothetical protein